MSFNITYVGGGMLDKVRNVGRIEGGRLDTPYMPNFTKPYIVGGLLDCKGNNSFVGKVSFDKDVELLLVAVDTNSYEVDDSWEVVVGDSNTRLVDTVAATNYPEGLNFMVAHLIPAETELKFVFHNYSGVNKFVWYHFQFLVGEGVRQLPVKPEEPPKVELSHPSNPFCFQFLSDGQSYKVTGIVSDDSGVRNYNVFIDGKREVYKDFSPPAKIDEFEIDLPVEVPPPPPKPKADIVFIMDTSGSMGDDIENVKTNLNNFKNKLEENDIDIYMGSVNSNPDKINRTPLTPAESFNLNVGLDKGVWEVLNWSQITNENYGGFSFIPEFREGSDRYFIIVTDTHINTAYDGSITDTLNKNNVIVTVIHELQDKDYDKMIEGTGGLNLEIRNPDFSSQMDLIAEKIISNIEIPPPQEYNVKVEAQDDLGLKTTEETTIKLEWCKE